MIKLFDDFLRVDDALWDVKTEVLESIKTMSQKFEVYFSSVVILLQYVKSLM